MTRTGDKLGGYVVREGGRGGERDMLAGRYREVEISVDELEVACAAGHAVAMEASAPVTPQNDRTQFDRIVAANFANEVTVAAEEGADEVSPSERWDQIAQDLARDAAFEAQMRAADFDPDFVDATSNSAPMQAGRVPLQNSVELSQGE